MTDAHAVARTTPPLAVVGLACRFPDADDPAALLDVVLAGRRTFRRLPPGRMDLGDYYQPDLTTSDATYSTRAALIEGWQFEQAAFGIDKAAYAAADPAHWLALETTARALAAAGLPAGTGLDRDRTGVIIGNTLTGDISRANALRVRWPYVRRVLTDALGSDEISSDQVGIVLQRAEIGYLAPFPPMSGGSLAGSIPATIATTISNYFGFRGGSHAVDSACSSSLQAVASACTALATGDLDAAVAGGVDLSLDPLELIGLAKAGLLARTDVRIYDEDPTGFLPGEGCGVVVLMRTADARAAGLPVYAEILGWGVSSGAVRGEPQSQASSQLLAMQRAYERSGVDPADIQYLEGNGAATRADDLAELTALSSIRAGARRQLVLGSVKANIGHAKAAAGAAGLIKTVLALGTGVLPPTTGAGRPHELIAEGGARIALPQQAGDWAEGTRLAAVSTMGIGGSNVHVVLRHEPGPRARQDRWLRSVPLLAKAARTGPASSQPPLTAGPECTPFLLHAPDRFALAAVLTRLADIAGWMSDAEMADLACMLGRGTGPQGRVRVGLVATRQDQLAVLAREAAALLPQLGEGPLTARPGIFAADDADGRVTLLLSGTSQSARGEELPDDITAAVTRCLDTLRWLESLGVLATSAVGHGLGILAGLAWAGVLGESEVVEIAELRAKYLQRSATKETAAVSRAVSEPRRHSASVESGGRHAAVPESGGRHAAGRRATAWSELTGSIALRTAIGQRFRFGPPRRRLISTKTGVEIRSVDNAIDLICAGFDAADKMPEAIAEAAVGATLLLESGPGRALVSVAAGLTRVPAISLQSGHDDALNRARVAAALFAAGALTEPQPLFARRQTRPLDIWREQVYLTSPCETAQPRLAFEDEQTNQDAVIAVPEPAVPEPAVPEPAVPEPAVPEVAVPEPAGAEDPAGLSPADRNGLASLRDEYERQRQARQLVGAAASAIASGQSVDGPAAAPDAQSTSSDNGAAGQVEDAAASGGAVPASPNSGTVAGLRPWARCFAETLRPVARLETLPLSLPRRLFAAARTPELTDLGGLFTADPEAKRTLAIVEDPGDDRSRITAVDAASDAVSTGELVVITTSADFTGFFATVHAEHPSLGVTVLRVPAASTSPAAILEFAHAEPGKFRELVIGADGTASEPVLTDIAPAGRKPSQLGPDDVVLISRDTRGAGLALAQVLACTGAGVAVIGRGDDHDDSVLVAGLEQLRSAGARVGYEVIDVTDTTSLTAAVQRIEDRLGPVTAIAHAATPDDHVPCQGLTDPAAGRKAAEAAHTLDRLAGAIGPGQLKLILTFGSVAGRYGLAGAGLQALSSGALASRGSDLAAAAAGCRALHVDLPPWIDDGLGEPPGLAAEFAAAGGAALDISTASRLLLKILMTAGLPGRLAVHGRIGSLGAWPAPTISQAAMTAAALPGGGRFLRTVAVHYQGIELVAESRLSLAADPYLADYRIDGMAVLPPVLALEALTQAASVLAGRPVRRATGVTLVSPVLIPSSGEACLRVCAVRDGDTIVAALRCADSSYLVDHARAEFSSADDQDQSQPAAVAAGTSALQPLAAGPAGLVDGAELYGPICFQSGRFRRVALLPEVTARSGRALARGADELPWFPAGSELAGTSFLLGSPGLNDVALQVLQACVPHRRVRAAGCDSVQFSGRSAEGPVEIRAVAEPVRSAAAPHAGRAVVVPGQAGAPAAENDASPLAAGGSAADSKTGASPAGTSPAGTDAAIAAAATGAVEMTAEERADMEVADRRPRSRKSRRTARRVTETHGQRSADRASGGDGDGRAGAFAPAGSLSAGVPPAETSQAEVLAAEAPLAEQRWDVEAVDASGHMLAAWRGIQLRDSGPLPRNAAWPPTLLSVFLERSAVELGLAGGLRVTVSCGQPDGTQPQLLSVIPAQLTPDDELPADRSIGAAVARLPLSTASAPGAGLLAGFTLTSRAPVPVACGWAAADAGRRQQKPSAGLAHVHARFRAEFGEPAAVLAARLEAVSACLSAAGADSADRISVTRTAGDGWAVLDLGDARLACTVVELSGVAAPVAVALMTGPHPAGHTGSRRQTREVVTAQGR